MLATIWFGSSGEIAPILLTVKPLSATYIWVLKGLGRFWNVCYQSDACIQKRPNAVLKQSWWDWSCSEPFAHLYLGLRWGKERESVSGSVTGRKYIELLKVDLCFYYIGTICQKVCHPFKTSRSNQFPPKCLHLPVRIIFNSFLKK